MSELTHVKDGNEIVFWIDGEEDTAYLSSTVYVEEVADYV